MMLSTMSDKLELSCNQQTRTRKGCVQGKAMGSRPHIEEGEVIEQRMTRMGDEVQ